MKNYNDFNNKLNDDTIVTIGDFDSVHEGHQYILKTLVTQANNNKLKTVVITFINNSKKITVSKDRQVIVDNEDKINQIKKFNIDYLFNIEFDKNITKISKKDFIKNILIDRMNCKILIIGKGANIGNKDDNENTFDICSKLGVKLIELDHIKDEHNNVISSTLLRTEIMSGNIEKVNKYLNYPYFIKGTVVSGDKRGRIIGYPTANLHIEKNILLPKVGVYVTQTVIDEKKYKSVTNIGMLPTFNGKTKTVETYIIDFNEDIYFKKIKLEFFKKIREEKKFNSIQDLIRQIEQDVKIVKEYYNKINL